MSFSKGNHGHGLDEKCVEGNRYDLRFQVPFKAVHCKLRSRRLILPSWWLFVHCFLVKLIIVLLHLAAREKSKDQNCFLRIGQKVR
jgi:hypothetical protein